MYIGVDLGTSGIKAIITDENGQILASHTAPLTVSRPHPLWSEQAPTDWWAGLEQAIQGLAEQQNLAEIKAIGLSGQMHGAVLLDDKDAVLRPAILWNDGRSEQQCTEIEQRVTNSRQLTGNLMMPGFTAPKLAWVREHEADVFARVNKVLLPKDYLRLKMTGDYASDMSDSAGTLWMDTGQRCWNEELLAACGLEQKHMPELFEGSQITGTLLPEVANKWGMQAVPVIAGGGDNAAGAVGVGILQPGQAMLSLGTSGVTFVVSDGFQLNPESALHSFCHALPDTWHLMSVHLSAASCVQWLADSVLRRPVAELFDENNLAKVKAQPAPFFLPYLSGERTPHNNPHASGNLFGLTHATEDADLVYAVLEGVSLAFADGFEALANAGTQLSEISLIGGGARSRFWRQMLANVLNCKVNFRAGGDVGPALGAARLAQVALHQDIPITQLCPEPELVEQHFPETEQVAAFAERRDKFKRLYQHLRTEFTG